MKRYKELGDEILVGDSGIEPVPPLPGTISTWDQTSTYFCSCFVTGCSFFVARCSVIRPRAPAQRFHFYDRITMRFFYTY